jgi:hypothetical protein
MNIWDNQWFTLSIHNQIRFFGKRKFYWKPEVCAHRKSMAEVTWTNDENCSDLYTTQHYFMTHCLQVFWLWFIIALDIKAEKLSSSKMVRYEATHYAMIDEQLK